ncbi:hypothetical protein AB0I60_28400 [Actinosynnema sp. NPDC050436]
MTAQALSSSFVRAVECGAPDAEEVRRITGPDPAALCAPAGSR